MSPNGGGVGAAAFLPERRTIPNLQRAIHRCRGCELYRTATQPVFGEGATKAPIVFIGEQPGDEEDRQGHPFVGPAGKLLRRALQDAELDNREIYITNAVKHFKFEERGKRRIHKKPKASEVAACHVWLEAEIAAIHPKVIVCLGATATLAVLGRAYRLTEHRGTLVRHAWAPAVTATIHPSAVLRAPEAEQRHEAYRQLVADLIKVRHAAQTLAG